MIGCCGSVERLKETLDKERRRADKAERQAEALRFLYDRPHLSGRLLPGDLLAVSKDRWPRLVELAEGEAQG